MNSFEVAEKLIKFPHLKKCFEGIFSADNLPRFIKKNHFIICNTDVLSGNGKHWYCVLKIDSSTLECFDSLGVNNEKKTFLTDNFKQRYVSKIKFNVTQVQSSETATCGLFVLYFLVHRFHNKDLGFTDLLNEIFVASLEENERSVNLFASEHF